APGTARVAGSTRRANAPAATASHTQDTAVSAPVSGHAGRPTAPRAREAHTTAPSWGTARAADSPSPSAASDRGGSGVATQSRSSGNPGRARPASNTPATTRPIAASTATAVRPPGSARGAAAACDMRTLHHGDRGGRGPGGAPPHHRVSDQAPRAAPGTATRRVLTGAGAVTAGSLIANVAAYLLHLPASRWLGPEGYGAFAALLSAQLLVAVPSLALQAVVARER